MTIFEIKKSMLLEKAIDDKVYKLRDTLQEIGYILDAFKVAAADKKKILSDIYVARNLLNTGVLSFDSIHSLLLGKISDIKEIRESIFNLKESDIEVKIV